MNNLTGVDIFYFLLGGIFGAAASCAYLLYRILKILRQMHGGEPTTQDEIKLAFKDVKRK